MNIRAATEQIEGTVRAYLSKDGHGLYRIPTPMQRPIIMMGPPGVGKTAVVRQVAEGLGINFVSYSITHHTRQSALGLPYIAEDEFGGRSYKVSRYTMSEIIAATYDAIEGSGVREGILFLDEVNCASETLAPAMLQFLQYKTFGQHRLPVGWVIVTAGNPPEYNRSARDFDPAMMDRMKRIDVEPDLGVWMDYATAHGMHPAITTYLASKPKNFYKVRASVNGARMVTARGWEDLSRMIIAYGHEGIGVDGELVSQYLQDAEIAEDFSLYLDLFRKYQDDYKVADILAGAHSPAIAARATAAPFDERIALINLLLDALLTEAHASETAERALEAATDEVDGVRDQLEGKADPMATLSRISAQAAGELETSKAKEATDTSSQLILAEKAELLDRIRATAARWAMDPALRAERGVLSVVQGVLSEAAETVGGQAALASSHLDQALDFLDACFGDGQELIVFTTRLAVDPAFMRFVADHGSSSFAEHGRNLMFHERGLDLLEEVDALRGTASGARIGHHVRGEVRRA